MIEYDEDEEFDGDEAIVRERSRRFKLTIGAMLILIAGLATTVAANITINSKGKTEFGQGLFSVKACDSWIGVTLAPSAAIYTYNSQTVSRVQQIIIYGLDSVACKGTNLQLQLFSTGSSTPLDLFVDANGANNNRVLMHIAANASAATREQDITLINNTGTNVGYADNYENISYDSTNGSYTWAIYSKSTPLAPVPAVNSVVVQSTSY